MTQAENTEETDEPNEYGFAGDGTAPEPQRDRTSPGQIDAEAIAVPGDDFTHPVVEALEGMSPEEK
jgi:hypothetical protein